jgi:hypothetical protein
MRLHSLLNSSIAVLAISVCVSTTAYGQGQTASFRDSADGAFDASEFMLSLTGFLAVPVIITEPAVGYGGGLFGAYFHKKSTRENTINRPDISIGGGGLTENGTWFAGGGHLGFWNEDRLRYTGFLFYANPKITFYFGRDLGIETPVNTNLEFWFLLQKLAFRLGRSNWFIGGEYMYYSSDVGFVATDKPVIDFILGKLEQRLVNSGLGISVLLDKRDNIYTPNKGIYWETTTRYFPEWLGTTKAYGAVSSDLKFFFQIIEEDLYLALKNHTSFVYDNAPFFTFPFVNMRGVKALRYQGEFINTLEAEARFRVYRRWSLLGFGGVGLVSSTLEDLEMDESVWAGGTGFRYMLARLFNLQAGLDFAWSEKDELTGKNQFAFYITVGSAL